METNRGTAALNYILVIAGGALVAAYGIAYLGKSTSEQMCNQMSASTLITRPDLVRETFGFAPEANLFPRDFRISMEHDTNVCTMRLRNTPPSACPPDSPLCTPVVPRVLEIWPELKVR